ncbi:hypothetical protein VTO42DRAFT_2364 [Malbranchea cinnamomea]
MKFTTFLATTTLLLLLLGVAGAAPAESASDAVDAVEVNNAACNKNYISCRNDYDCCKGWACMITVRDGNRCMEVLTGKKQKEKKAAVIGDESSFATKFDDT